MTKQIRRSVFETNSSSSHSLTLGRASLVKPPLSPGVARDGVIEVQLGEFGWGYDEFHGLEGKLSYLVTQRATALGINYDMSTEEARAKLDADLWMQFVRGVVLDFTGARIEVGTASGYIDHQSVGMCDDLFTDLGKMRQFLFDDTSYVTIDNDNH